jgi:DNA-binding transcriptional LysR family regulator
MSICPVAFNLERHGLPAHPNKLRDHAALTYGFLLTGNQWKLTEADGDHWIHPSWQLCANNAEVLRDAAVKGRGIALLPKFIAGAALRAGKLRTVLDDYKAQPLTLYAIYPPTRDRAAKVTEQPGDRPLLAQSGRSYANGKLRCSKELKSGNQ